MRHRLYVCLGLILVAVVWFVPTHAQQVSLTSQVIERTLPNGLKVLMVKRPEVPLIRCILAYRVGAVNEEISTMFAALRQFQANDPMSACCVPPSQSLLIGRHGRSCDFG